MIEGLFIYMEKKANKTDLMHYAIICFNGRFGWVPLSNNLKTASQEGKSSDYLNYDNINSSVCCMNFRLDFKFTDDSLENLTRLLTQIAPEENPVKR